MSEGLIEELKDVAEHLDFNVQMYEFDNKAMDEDPEGHKNMIGMEKKFLQTVLDTICYLGEKDIQWFDEVHQHNYDLNTKFDKN